MRQSIIIGSFIGSFIIFCMTINLFDSALMFLLFGVLPNRINQLSAGTMLGMYEIVALIITLVLSRSIIVSVMKSLTSPLRDTSISR